MTAATLLTLATLIGCASHSVDDHSPTGEQTPTISLPPVAAAFDYQLGGAYEPGPAVQIVVRDRLAPPADDRYSVCYLNAFQTQPDELDNWPDDLLLHDADGDIVYDPDWPDEALIDTRDAERVAAIVTPWIDQCADAGYDAVEFDNLDTYTRTNGLLTRDDNLTLASALVTRAHDAGLAAAQKNAAEDAALLHTEAGFDFAITEECAAYDECDAYTDVYGDHVLAIEYSDPAAFADACAAPDRPASLIHRDRALTKPEEPGYVFELCP
ncbi:endo alpha-1,4 polygalactosaminidase [Microbacterium invictum]|uniref:Glycoside-hydrolase family GH114 TIM-barrel domain-containing protein n=1 Tax=Microbacterium invictum TaxID=515415 RepID=A0AA40SLP6_9MICO|nr:endo alpha-1,4 polygalactosaminidase [Microbacterium invictum]MBB4138523.1 hypothetical protein [Microbacterium invictum]